MGRNYILGFWEFPDTKNHEPQQPEVNVVQRSQCGEFEPDAQQSGGRVDASGRIGKQPEWLVCEPRQSGGGKCEAEAHLAVAQQPDQLQKQRQSFVGGIRPDRFAVSFGDVMLVWGKVEG